MPIAIIPFLILIHDGASGRFSVFRVVYDIDDLNASLFEAARVGDIEKTRVLLQRGADANAKDVHGWTQLYYVSTDFAEILARLSDARGTGRRGPTPLHKAAFGGHNRVAALLLRSGAHINAKCADGRTSIDFTLTEDMRAFLRNHGAKSGKEIKD